MLALFDPVSPWPAAGAPAVPTGCYPYYVGYGGYTDHQHSPPSSVPGQQPYSTFAISSHVQNSNAYDWWQPFSEEYDQDLAVGDTQGYATGSVSGLASGRNVQVGTYHTSQIDPNNSNAWTNVFAQQIFNSTLKSAIESLPWVFS